MLASSSRLVAASARRLAAPVTPGNHNLGLVAAALIPPLPLYRRLLRGHRKFLPADMRSLGDAYVKDEFRRHQKVDQPLQIVGFISQWVAYLNELEQGAGKFEGRRLERERFEKLSDEQLYQLHEFMTAAKELYDPSKAQAQPPGGARAVQEAVDGALRRVREEEEEQAAGKKKQ